MKGLFDWIKRNTWNLAGVALGIGGLVSGYWFYRASLQISSLSFVDHDPHAQVIDYRAMSASSVKLVRQDNTTVEQNVYSARLYIWNSGNVSLRRPAVLQPLTIQLSEGEILDAKRSKISREITKAAITSANPKWLLIDFDILEPNDGFSVNVLYAAPQPGAFTMTGIVEGVKSFSPIEVQPYGTLAIKAAWVALKNCLTIGLFIVGLRTLGWLFDTVSKFIPKNRITEFLSKMLGAAFLIGLAIILLYALLEDSWDEAKGTPKALVPPALIQ